MRLKPPLFRVLSVNGGVLHNVCCTQHLSQKNVSCRYDTIYFLKILPTIVDLFRLANGQNRKTGCLLLAIRIDL